jgi:hypothetical protein
VDRGTIGPSTQFVLVLTQQRGQRPMTRKPRRDENAVDRNCPVIGWLSTPDRGQRTAGFVHQKIGRRKVPIGAVPTCECDIQRTVGDAGEPQRQRMNPRQNLEWRGDRGEAIENPLRPGHPRPCNRLAGTRVKRDIVAGSAAAGDGKKEFVSYRRVERSEYRPSVLDQCRRDRPVRSPGEERPRAVDRIDNEDARGREPVWCILGFLRQPSGASTVSLFRSSSSTAMSASETGEDCPLNQIRTGLPKASRASAPASRSAAANAGIRPAGSTGRWV